MEKTNEGGKKHLSDEQESFKKFLKIEDGDPLWKEWQNEPADEACLEASISDQIIRAVAEKTGHSKIRRMWYRPWVAAAIAAAVVPVVLYFFFLRREDQQKQEVIIAQREVQIVEQQNNSTKDMRLVLPDHSVVFLHPRSSISYDAAGFKTRDTSARGIFLTGSAFFKVAKNARKPFTVYSGDLSTVALGTEFDVVKKNQNTTIKLYKGKVVVRALRPHKGWTREVVLLPGQMVSLNEAVPQKIKTGTVLTKKNNTVAGEKRNGKKTLHGQSLPLQCDHMQLADVLKILEQYYNVRISYDKELLTNKYFSGELLPEKSPDEILRIICSMQQLIVEKNNSGYLIRK